ncbi:hypothetical protein [Sphingosinicella sp. LY1275]|uniref:hypothetical protein n=1 Tax=Sphingosinicella sp. LY1275 TaxID=3095379 RepID=UPI002ADED82D|nr:hypothetical protein [Sphingosinicella sp. LY1275]MEA1015335.1 hypothetical protein [Sphingosinicella sp. LY1275]
MPVATEDEGGEASPLTPRQERLVQAVADFQMALSAIDFMCELDEHRRLTRVERRRYRCFEDAAVIAYGRAFSNAEGLPFLVFKHMDFKPTPDEKELHDRLIERRRKVVAHSDADRQRILFATEEFEADNGTFMIPHVDFDDALAFYSDRLRIMEWLRRLIHAVGAVLFNQVQGVSPIHFVRDHTQPR